MLTSPGEKVDDLRSLSYLKTLEIMKQLTLQRRKEKVTSNEQNLYGTYIFLEDTDFGARAMTHKKQFKLHNE